MTAGMDIRNPNRHPPKMPLFSGKRIHVRCGIFPAGIFFMGNQEMPSIRF